MITPDGKLQVFEAFRVDRKLPKHAKGATGGLNLVMHSQFTPAQMQILGGSEDDAEEEATSTLFNVRRRPRVVQTSKPSWWQRLLRRAPPAPAVELTVEEFFAHAKNSLEELEVVGLRAAGYEAALDRARRTGQLALAEQIVQGAAAARSEAQLLAMGLPKYLREATIVDFVKKSPKGLRLDWVANFTRVIPDEVIARKVRADELEIFDNYVVLHFDPKATSWAETEAEKARRKDPILFGLMEGRRLLYYVGDWVDELCGLTLDEIADQMGADAIRVLSPSEESR